MQPATLRTQVTFWTSRFNQTEVRPYFINPNCFGDDCAAWLVSGLHERGWKDLSEPWQEDWGWQTSTAREGRKYLISVGSTEEDSPGWLVHVVLMTGPEVEHIRWHFEDVFMGEVASRRRRR